jgi:uncharacterized membrane protein
MRVHMRHHQHFYASLAIGVLVWMMAGVVAPPLHLALAGDTFFGAYLAMMLGMIPRITVYDLRKKAAVTDEGNIIIVLFTLAAIVLSFGSIFSLLSTSRQPNMPQLILLLLSVPLGWIALHTIMAFHYAHLFYRRRVSDMNEDAGGLQFPGTSDPEVWDFLYYSFVVGMTAQVSDVQVISTAMRRMTLVHGVVAFFFNTVIVALAVNVAVGTAH